MTGRSATKARPAAVPRVALSALIGCSAVAITAPQRAAAGVTKLEGEYVVQLDVRKQDRFFPWDYDYNIDDSWGSVQFRLFSQPMPGAEAFVKFEEDWNRYGNNGRRPEFQYHESHLRYRWEKAGRGFDTYVFSRQDRYWVENHLIEVVRPGTMTDGGNGQGIRLDLFGYARTNVTYILSDFSGQSTQNTNRGDPRNPVGTDDAHVFRARREFLGGALRTGITYNRLVQAFGYPDDPKRERGHTEVFAGDLRCTLRGTDILLEYAQSRNTNTAPQFRRGRFDRLHLGDLAHPDRALPSDAVLRAEIRSLRIGSPRLGYYSIAPSYWFLGSDYNNPLGDPKNDERGMWINTWYLVPQRAITLTLNYLRYKKERFEQKDITEFYGEIYTEYVNGFRSKIAHRRRKTRDYANPLFTDITKNHDLFAEVQVESHLAWMRIQGKIKDIGTERRKELASLETSVNLTRTVKVYNRFAFANDPARVRKGLFSELQFRPRPNMEMFLSYGPWWIGDNPNPVDDGDLEGGADNKDIVKFTLRGVF